MDLLTHIKQHHENKSDEYSSALPVPSVVLDNFLPENFAKRMFVEAQTIPEEYWTTFTRNGSLMKECVQLAHMPIARDFVAQMHSSDGLRWLEALTGVPGLIPDPHITGAGYSKSWSGDSLQVHTDFNWNEQLKLHRACAFIIYLTPDWKSEYNGAFEFWDFDKTECVKSVDCFYNRALIWNDHKRGFHGYPKAINCPEDMHRTTFRLFFYTSNSTYKKDDRPHRSLYWFDREMNEPYDIPSRK